MKTYTVEILHKTGMVQKTVEAKNENSAKSKAQRNFEAWAKKRCMSGCEIISVTVID